MPSTESPREQIAGESGTAVGSTAKIQYLKFRVHSSVCCYMRCSVLRVNMIYLQDSREVFVTGDGARTAFERRPHLTHFLESVSTLFEIVVFTAGSQVGSRSCIVVQM